MPKGKHLIQNPFWICILGTYRKVMRCGMFWASSNSKANFQRQSGAGHINFFSHCKRNTCICCAPLYGVNKMLEKVKPLSHNMHVNTLTAQIYQWQLLNWKLTQRNFNTGVSRMGILKIIMLPKKLSHTCNFSPPKMIVINEFQI